MYGEKDGERRIPSTMTWLTEELGELAQAVRKESREQQLHELGDVVARIVSFANQLVLDLDDALTRFETWAREHSALLGAVWCSPWER
jgi:NTP pyrophosphatase (non-canonical NTP hydrolase)